MISSDYMRLPSYIFTFVLCFGIYLVFIKEDAGSLLERLKKMADQDSQAALLLRRAGINMNARTYYLAVIVFPVLIFLFGAVKSLMTQDLGLFLLGALGGSYIYWMLRPVETVFKDVKSPFARFADILAKDRKRRIDRGIYEVSINLKNLAIVQESSPLSADMMLEKLAVNAPKDLQPIFMTTLQEYRTGKSSDAFSYFARATGTPTGRSMASILSKLDRINPKELKEQIIALIDMLSDQRVTEGYKLAQRSGVITMLLATMTVMIGMMDFLVIVVFLDMLKMLASVF